MHAEPKITVAICTHDRAKYLTKALESIRKQSLSKEAFEVVAVDNASTDSTASVVEQAKSTLPNLRYVFEPNLGLSKARNRALAEATGLYIAYLDDDAIASPQWLDRLLTAFETIRPPPAVVGGRIDPIWECERPVWLPDELMMCFTIVDWCSEPKSLNPWKQSAFGANMAFVTSLLREVGGFDVGLGRVGHLLLSGEDVLVQRRLFMRGHSVHYDPRASVRHHVQTARLTKQWLLNRMFCEGLSDAMMTVKLNRLSRSERVLLALKPLAGFIRRPRAWTKFSLSNDDAAQLFRRCEGRHRLGMAWGLLAYSDSTTQILKG